jgi:hypothetical protein
MNNAMMWTRVEMQIAAAFLSSPAKFTHTCYLIKKGIKVLSASLDPNVPNLNQLLN